MNTSVTREDSVRPKITLMAMVRIISLPSCWENTRGSIPRMVVSVVMRMGRRRRGPAVVRAS